MRHGGYRPEPRAVALVGFGPCRVRAEPRARRAACGAEPPWPPAHNAAMHIVVVLAALIAAGLHAWFFVLESLWFLRPSVWSRFGLRSQDEAATVRSFAYNQGFYNLFLAAGAVGGVAKALLGDPAAGVPVMLFACASMVAAGVVLLTHNRSFWRPAAIQIGPPLVAILAQLVLA